MSKSIGLRTAFLALLILAALVYLIPSLTSELPPWWPGFLPQDKIHLGLDLQGGTHMILEVEAEKAVESHVERVVEEIKQDLRKNKIRFDDLKRTDNTTIQIVLQREEDGKTFTDQVAPNYKEFNVERPIRGEKGIAYTMTLSANAKNQIMKMASNQALETIRNRIDQFGVSEPDIRPQGDNRIVVQLPGIKDPERAKELIGKTALLEFKLVDEDNSLEEATKGSVPPGDEILRQNILDKRTGQRKQGSFLLKKRSLITGEYITDARVAIDSQYGEPYVSMSFDSRGARLFERITGENVGKRLAIVLDGNVYSAPVIRDRIGGGKAQITGSFTMDEAKDLAIVLRAGALPAPVKVIEERSVGPSLGRDSIQKGISSAVLGTALVVLFMIVYYGVSGGIADLALFLNVLLMVAGLSMLQATLTLPGIAGIILSIGMAVDSNVLIFERMREEAAFGKPVRASVLGGYDKALWTVIDSHVTTLITAFALFLFGTGPIKGFAVTLSIGVILNLFTALYGTRIAYDFLHLKRWHPSIRFLQIIRNPRINFMRLRNAAFVFSGFLVLLGLFAFVQIYRGNANLGVDFAGGALVQFKAEKNFRLEDVRSALTHSGVKDYELQEVPRERILIVRVKDAGSTVGAVSEQIASVLAKDLPESHFVMQSKDEIGASISKDLKRAAVVAIAMSIAGIIIYLAWRFDFRFGVAAAIATFHDVLAVLGVFYLLDKEITLLIVTALLTLAGYSLTDTVVVFDRIRENMRKSKRQDLGEIINQSVNEVLSRTIITSSTVFMVLLALLLLGGVVTYDFALALTMGVIVGTYSSVFVASAIVYIWPSKATSKKRVVLKASTRAMSAK